MRLARAHSIRLHTFCDLAWPKKQIWTRDIDKSADREILEVLARKTATPPRRVFAATLRKYEGRVYERLIANSNSPWIMPIGVYHRKRRRFGLQFCPKCLAEDKDPYFRCRWRLAFVTVCEKHRCLLQDRCSQCGEPICFHRTPPDAETIILCPQCGFDLSTIKEQSDGTLTAQASILNLLLRIATTGWVLIPGQGPVYSHLYFAVLRQIIKVLARKKAWEATNLLLRQLSISVRFSDSIKYQHDVELMGLHDRLALVELAWHLLNVWPNNFIQFCRQHQIWSSELLRDMRLGIPFWYWRMVNESLYHPSYGPTDKEILEASKYLRKKGMLLSKRKVSKVLGVREVCRKRKKTKEENLSKNDLSRTF
ncbi:hypothetical protein Pcar_0123 [Syntrophotalea carbinolica DSM 2380]|uniref:TniQ domain-containing protein n=1 Tax=Syntrophotalea carbinolica (strain DSM 2380 / NBRC 103641 / GraBd1) TaxID=338963 RepID=Q3A8A7_SYNC1|nr:hypothetical protein Pcar_0123 [Syntrophotalea carbinolica DSM 2380]